jgi:hypothetical protein
MGNGISDSREALKLLDRNDIDYLFSKSYKIKLPYRWRGIREGYDNLSTNYISIIELESGYLVNNRAFYGDMLRKLFKKPRLYLPENYFALITELHIIPESHSKHYLIMKEKHLDGYKGYLLLKI